MKIRTWGVWAGLLLLHAGFSLSYYHQSWERRRLIHRWIPSFNSFYMQQGFGLMNAWDALAWTGQDAEVELTHSCGGPAIYGGVPEHGENLSVLTNIAYTVAYSDRRGNPLWVAYRLFDVPTLEAGRRPDYFKMDRRTQARIPYHAMSGSGYDRGHMAPNYGIATRYGNEAQAETFLMSNVTPQSPYINRRIWRKLEIMAARNYGRYFEEVWVITGPVFEGAVERLAAGVDVPTHFYKILVDERAGRLRAMAFLIEQDPPPFTRLRTRLTSIDHIEHLTGIDFFPALPNEAEQCLERTAASRLWPSLQAWFWYRFNL